MQNYNKTNNKKKKQRMKKTERKAINITQILFFFFGIAKQLFIYEEEAGITNTKNSENIVSMSCSLKNLMNSLSPADIKIKELMVNTDSNEIWN